MTWGSFLRDCLPDESELKDDKRRAEARPAKAKKNERATTEGKPRINMMQVMQRHLESGRSSSSYGSLDDSTGIAGKCTSCDRTAGGEADARSSASSHACGLSMHVHKEADGCDRASSPNSVLAPAATATAAATSAANAISNNTAAANAAAAYGSDEFPDRLCADERSCRNGSSEQPHHPAHQEHLVKSRQYYRDAMLGVNDGLVSTFLLIAGVVGGGMEVDGVLLTAISGAIAGAISMFAGEYVATKSQNEVMEGEIKLEHDHIRQYHAEEMEELTHLLSLIGIPGSQPHLCFDNDERSNRITREARKRRRRMMRYYAANPDALLKIMIALEFGVIDEEVRSPFVAGATSLALFFVGALPSVIPFAFVDDPTLGLIIAGLACGIGLFIVGAVKTWATRGNMWLAALENLAITAAGGAVAYGIGVGFQALVGEEEELGT